MATVSEQRKLRKVRAFRENSAADIATGKRSIYAAMEKTIVMFENT